MFDQQEAYSLLVIPHPHASGVQCKLVRVTATVRSIKYQSVPVLFLLCVCVCVQVKDNIKKDEEGNPLVR